MKKILFSLTVLLSCQAFAEVLLVPVPTEIKEGEKTFILRGNDNSGSFPKAQRHAKNYGLTDIQFSADSALAPEAYLLQTSEKGITVKAADEAGAFYALQTLRQLKNGNKIPEVSINDKPRFAWRGLMIDDCRHFMGKDVVKKTIDTMVTFKMNTLHWHLTDDQGWRIEIKKYPDLIRFGAVRDESPMRWNRNKSDKTPYGPFFYTQEEIKEIVAYAAERNVTVVPEIEMPGHAAAALAAFPKFSCTGREMRPRWEWGVEPDIFCAGNDDVLRFLEDVLDEVVELFPSSYIHVGGDEAPKDRWNVCAKCRDRIKTLGLKNSHHLQSWFIQHFANYLKAKGRNLIGWDEILEGGLAKGAAVMSWRGTSGGIAAAKAGHNVVMSPHTFLYFDYNQNLPNDKFEYIGGKNEFQHVYSFNPTDKIPEEMHKFIIGVQGNNWSEYTWGAEDLEWKIWPRALALAEIAWSNQSDRSWENFQKRLPVAIKQLDEAKINYGKPLPKLVEKK